MSMLSSYRRCCGIERSHDNYGITVFHEHENINEVGNMERRVYLLRSTHEESEQLRYKTAKIGTISGHEQNIVGWYAVCFLDGFEQISARQ